jgi:hypothetical protein
MKKLINYLLAFMLSLLSVNAVAQVSVDSENKAASGVAIKEYSYKESADSSYIVADIKYFQILGTSDLANVVNNMVLDVYMGMAEGIPDNPNVLIAEYFVIQNKEIDTLVKEMGGTEFLPYSFDYEAQVVLNNDSLFTFKQFFYDYSGGAHGNGGEKYNNLDAKTGDRLSLADLFNEDEIEALTIMGEKAFREEQEIPNDKTLNEWGYEFEDGFYLTSNFLINDSNIVFYYAPYEIACYAMGPSSFELPIEAIKAKFPDAKLFEYIN